MSFERISCSSACEAMKAKLMEMLRLYKAPFGIFCVSIAIASCLFWWRTTQKRHANSLAQSAYTQLIDEPFVPDSISDAQTKLARAIQRDPDAVWVHIGLGELALTQGYKIGDWFWSGAYDTTVLPVARLESIKAVSANPNEPMAWNFKAKIDIIDRKMNDAVYDIDQVFKLDTSLRNPCLLNGRLDLEFGDAKGARKFYLEALSDANTERQKEYARSGLAEAARLNGDSTEELKWRMRNVKSRPLDAYTLGMVAEWYTNHKQWPEAVQWWGKVIAITPFPHALKKFQDAKDTLALSESLNVK